MTTIPAPREGDTAEKMRPEPLAVGVKVLPVAVAARVGSLVAGA